VFVYFILVWWYLMTQSTGPGDFDLRSNFLVTIPANEMEVTVEVNVTDDDIVEDVESFTAILTLPADETLVEIGSNFEAVARIIDNDRKLFLDLEIAIE